MRIKKVKQIGTVVPNNAEILNEHSTSTKDVYACDYINNISDYSTEEQVVGRWIDGKPLYRKVIEKTNTQGSTITIPHNILNIDKIISYNSCFKDNINNDYRSIPLVSVSNLDYQIGMSINTTNIVINAPGYTDTGRFNYIYVVIYYTKTTD